MAVSRGRPKAPAAGFRWTDFQVAVAFALAATPFGNSRTILVVVSFFIVLSALLEPGSLRLQWPLALFLMWCVASISWSAAPSLTMKAVLKTVLIVAAASLAVQRWGVRRVFHDCALGAKVVLLVSWAIFFLNPATGRSQGIDHPGAFRGLFTDRNAAAFAAVVFLIFFLCATTQASTSALRVRAWLWAGLAAVTVLATQSGTGRVMAGVAAVIALIMIRMPSWSNLRKRVVTTIGALLLGSVAFWSATNLREVAQLVGRDATLTGRTVIWDVVERHMPDVLYHGFGWGALWQPGVPITQQMWAEGGFRFYHAHEAYFDYILQVGLVGLALVLGSMLLSMGRALRTDERVVPAVKLLTVASVITLLGYAATEQSFDTELGLFLIAVCASAVRERNVTGRASTVAGPGSVSGILPGLHPGRTGSVASRGRATLLTDSAVKRSAVRGS